MSQECRNIYQIARDASGLTQERAAELLDVSVESIRAYEYGKWSYRIPRQGLITAIETGVVPYIKTPAEIISQLD